MRLITSNPLNPSIKFAPLTTNKKHNNTKIKKNIHFSLGVLKKEYQYLLF